VKDLARVGEELEEMKEALAGLERDASGQWELRLARGTGRGAGGFLDVPGLTSHDKNEPEPGVGSTKDGPGTGGPPTRTEATRTPREVTGRWGEGPSLIEIVKGVASEGVATTAYRNVAESAARSAEDAVHSEDIPLGYRFYIKRYFQTIRPAERSSDK
jgi:hypothetical protein